MPAHEGAVTGVPVADAAKKRTALWRLLVSVSVVVQYVTLAATGTGY